MRHHSAPAPRPQGPLSHLVTALLVLGMLLVMGYGASLLSALFAVKGGEL